VKFLSSSRAALVAAVVIVLGATGVALAAGSGPTTIHGCYLKQGGALRHVKSGSACKSSEVAIAWNERGPRGPRGRRGPVGPAGSARAYAAVNADATLDAARSKNIDHVSDFGTGSYCVFLAPSIDVSTVAAMVSLVGADGSQDTAIYVDAGACLEDTTAGIFVKTTDLTGTDKAAPFYLMVP
jgi:hypothetical protein